MSGDSIDVPPVSGIVETCINVAEMHRALKFYQLLFGFEVLESDERFCAFSVGKDVLLLFLERGSEKPVTIAGGIIPPHQSLGAGHFAFAITAGSLDAWRARLTQQNIELESEVRWARGGASLYFRDPDNNLLELVTPGIWANY
jgi:catechol 2,3-dioxygenase-like lactoylglutathione lyase family enzyme